MNKKAAAHAIEETWKFLRPDLFESYPLGFESVMHHARLLEYVARLGPNGGGHNDDLAEAIKYTTAEIADYLEHLGTEFERIEELLRPNVVEIERQVAEGVQPADQES